MGAAMVHALINFTRRLAFYVFRTIAKPLMGTGIGLRCRPLGKAFEHLRRLVIAEDLVLMEVEGSKMYLKPREHTFATALLLGKAYEKCETDLFNEAVEEGMVVIDCGANIGYYTLLAAKLVGERGKVFAFEPEPSNYALLVKNIEVNGYSNVVPIRKAITDRTGTIKLSLADDPSGHSIGQIDRAHARGVMMVDSVTLDEFLKQNITPIDVIKMDIEGAEMRALDGMENIIRQNPDLKIITEFCPFYMEKCGSSAATYFERLKSHGFKIYVIDEHRQCLEMVSNVKQVTKLIHELAVSLLCQRTPYTGQFLCESKQRIILK